MARIFITGSSDGLGLMTGRLLAERGPAVVLHARKAVRDEALQDRLLDRCRDVSGVTLD